MRQKSYDFILSQNLRYHNHVKTKMEAVQRQAALLAKNVHHILGTRQSEYFLETIYIPFLSFFMMFKELGISDIPKQSFFLNFKEFYDFGFGNECQSPHKRPEQIVQYKEGRFDVIFPGPTNLYERLAYLICNVSFSELRLVDSKHKTDLSADTNLRRALSDSLTHFPEVFPFSDIIDFLPLSLLEGLQYKDSSKNYPVAKYHWLGSVYEHEDYLFFLAHLKENGSIIIGQPHGGCYCQFRGVMGNEISDRILSDIYHSPSWTPNTSGFPNWRVSRNLFLNIKNLFLRKPKTKKKMLVLLSYFYLEREPLQNKIFTGAMTTNDFYYKQLLELDNHFNCGFDFKLYPRQDISFMGQLDYLKQLYPESEFILNGSVLSLIGSYDGIIHLDTWGTALIELAGTRAPQYVYLGPEILLNKGYELFLWNTRKSSTRSNYSNGAFIQIDNAQYKRAYGASFLYPFYFANLFK